MRCRVCGGKEPFIQVDMLDEEGDVKAEWWCEKCVSAAWRILPRAVKNTTIKKVSPGRYKILDERR